MSIEVSSAPKGVKAAANADSNGKRAGKTGAVAGDGSSGFSVLMNLLSVAEDGAAGLAADASLADASLTEKDGQGGDVATAGVGLLLQPFATPTSTVPTPVPATSMTDPLEPTAVAWQPVGIAVPPSAIDSAGLSVTQANEPPSLATESIGLPGKTGHQSKTADTSTLQKPPLASAASDTTGMNTSSAQAAVDATHASPVSALLAHKSAVQAQTQNAMAQDLKEARASVVPQSVAPATDAATTLMAGGLSDLLRPQGRFGAKSGMGQSGSSGFESAFGQAMAGTNRADAAFEVPATSATVPDTAVAETVSYWASHGVQTAELKLDGFGDEPVEVSILLNGDQAQIDFRTDQAGVRQVLENAAAQLKDMLSSQGLQLAGVSVGTSGKGGDTGSERRQRPGVQQVTLVKTDAIVAATSRAANPAVGRSLDLFV